MPTLESVEYERFSYDDASTRSLGLDEAVKKAADLRRTDPRNFYRVEAMDANATAFRVEKVSVASVYVDFVARFAQKFMRRGMASRT